MLKPCRNNGNCTNDNTTANAYICTCPPGFDGAQCQLDNRPCKPTTCWNNGTSYLLYSIINMIYFEVYAMKHQIQHLTVYVQMVGQVFIVKQW
jgi:hypothetical protein